MCKGTLFTVDEISPWAGLEPGTARSEGQLLTTELPGLPEHAEVRDQMFTRQLFYSIEHSYYDSALLTLKAPNEKCSRRHFIFLLLFFEENKASCESSA